MFYTVSFMELVAHYVRSERRKVATVKPGEDIEAWRAAKQNGLRQLSPRAKMGLFFKVLIRLFYYPLLLLFVGGVFGYVTLASRVAHCDLHCMPFS